MDNYYTSLAFAHCIVLFSTIIQILVYWIFKNNNIHSKLYIIDLYILYFSYTNKTLKTKFLINYAIEENKQFKYFPPFVVLNHSLLIIISLYRMFISTFVRNFHVCYYFFKKNLLPAIVFMLLQTYNL